MTTLAAVARYGVVHMASDSMTNVYDRPILGVPKIVRLPAGPDAEMLIGVCGDGAMIELLRSDLKVDGAPRPGEGLQPWATAVARAATDLAVSAVLVEDGRMSGSLVLGFAGQLWTIVHGQAVPHRDGVAAIGSGEGPAIGAMDALLGRGVDPVEAVVTAVQIAIARDRYSGGDVQLEVLDPPVARPVARKAAAKKTPAAGGRKGGA